MKTEERRAFIINFLYYAIWLMIAFVILRYGLPMLTPFVAAFVIAYLLNTPICFAAKRLRLPRKAMAIFAVLLFYCTVGSLIALLFIKLFSSGRVLFSNFTGYLQPLH